MGWVAQAASLSVPSGKGSVARNTQTLGSRAVEVSPHEVVVVGGPQLIRFELSGCDFGLSDARYHHRFVRHLQISRRFGLGTARLDLITDPRLGMIAPRAARLLDLTEATAIITAAQLATVTRWLDGNRRLLGLSISDLARLSSVASVVFAVAIGERAADLTTQMSWERGLPLRSSPFTNSRALLSPFEQQAAHSERAHLALMAALAHMGRHQQH